jgi:hypothetical protein
MKAIIALAVFSVVGGSLVAAEPKFDRGNDSQQSQQPSSANSSSSSNIGSQIISEPAGAERPRGRAFSTNDLPPGRAFQTNDLPNGRPFQEGTGPNGRPFREPSGAATGTNTNSSAASGAVTGAESSTNGVAGSVSSTSNTNQGSSSSGTQVKEAAGAQRAESQKLAVAFESHEKVQIEQAIRANLSTTVSTKVPDEFVTRLSSDLSTAFTRIQISQEQRIQLANAVAVILSAQPSAEAEVHQAFSTVESTLLQGANTTPLAQAAVCDLHLIATQLIPGFKMEGSTTSIRVK